jgi:DNA-binding response OmpR family regulator
MKKKILIVEDERALLNIVQLILKNAYEVEIALNGRQGLERATASPPDLILLDITMPEMDGLEVLKRLKDNPSTTMIPVILLTGRVEHESVLKGYKTGADYYIAKPFTQSQLLNGIHLFLDHEKTASGS